MNILAFRCRAVVCLAFCSAASLAAGQNPDVDRAIERGLDWLASRQSRLGHWTAAGDAYPTAMTALAGTALLCEGSTTTQGRYAPQIAKAVDYLLDRARSNGLIGDPHRDDRYTYGHGYALLFLSQVLGEEEDFTRRERLIEALTLAVQFTGRAQTAAGGWGYISAKDGGGFDEGSTTITQVQGLRSCRNAGIPVPKEIIDKAVKYIKDGTGKDGGVRYSSQGGGEGRPPITAAAVACLYNAGDYDNRYVPKLLGYCRKHFALDRGGDGSLSGHWHYAHYYYAQVMYREGGSVWEEYQKKIFRRIVSAAAADGSWNQSYIGPVYTTAVNLTILQLPKATLPIYQR